MKTKDKIISIVDATVAAYSNSPVWYKTSIEKYMEEYSYLQNRSLVEENERLKKENNYMKNFLLEVQSTFKNSFVKQSIDGIFVMFGKPALSYKEGERNG